MYKVRIRGEREAIMVHDNKKGYEMEQNWLGGKFNGEMVSISGGTYKGDDIRSVVRVTEPDRKDSFDVEYTPQELDEFGLEVKPYTCKVGDAYYQRWVENYEKSLQKGGGKFSVVAQALIDKGIEELDKNPDALHDIAQSIVGSLVVGKFVSQEQWEQFLVDKLAIVRQGESIAIVWDAGGARYSRYEAIKDAYELRRSRREYAEMKQIEEDRESGLNI